MKRILTLLLAVCLLTSSLALLTACAHKCEYSTTWSSDDNDHWHACSKSDCTLVADKGAHTWNEGTVTTKPSENADGVKTFACTVCQKERTETVKFTGLAREEWDEVITKDVFDNFTFSMVTVAEYKGISAETKLTYFITSSDIYATTEMAGESSGMLVPKDQVQESKDELIEIFENMFDYDDYKYDEATKTYVATKEIKLELLDDMKTSDAVVRFENGKPVEYKCSGKSESSDGTEVDMKVTFTFIDYGTTKIPDTAGNV